MQTAIVLTNGLLQTSDAKTAHGLIRGTGRYRIMGVIDPPTAGRDAGEVLDGKTRNIPVFATLESALEALGAIDCLIVGVATVGGILPADMLVIIKNAIQNRLSIVNGLHDYLNENTELVSLATQFKVSLTDVRKPKSRKDLHFWTGAIFEVKTPIIAVMGMDCAMGKRTAARLITEVCATENLRAQMIYTGQTGWLQGGEYGFIFDSTLNDFVSGELEHAIVSCWKETNPDLILLEGQSALRNPSGPCGLELLISGQAKNVVLVHAPKRKYYDMEPHWGEIPPVETEIDIIEKFGSKVIALALNTEDCSDAEALDFQAFYEQKMGIPTLLPLQQGVSKILPILQNLLTQKGLWKLLH